MTRRPPGASRLAFERRLGVETGKLNGLFDQEPWLLFSTGRLTQAAFWSQVCAGFPLPPDAGLAAALWSHLFEAPKVREELVALLRQIRGRTRLGLLSNAGPDLRATLGPAADLFDDVVISAEVGLRKPQPEIFQLALRRLGVEAADAVFIDDLQRNIDAARSLGLHAYRFVTPGQVKRLLTRRGLLDTLGCS